MRIIVVCGAGASSTFVALRVRRAADARGLRVDARAAAEAGLAEALRDADVLLVAAVDDEGDLIAEVDALRDDPEDARRIDGSATRLADGDSRSRRRDGLGEELCRPGVQAVGRSDSNCAFHHDSGSRRWLPFPTSP